MSETQPYKYYFDKALAEELSRRILVVYPSFSAEIFIRQVADQVDDLELKDRVAVIAAVLRDHLPQDYPEAVSILLKILGPENSSEEGMFNDGFQLMPVAYFIEAYGLDHFEVSLAALYDITKRHTAEFAIRPFLVRYQEKTLRVLEQWVTDESAHVRRLVSEGTRPRLPWAARLQTFVKDPRPVLHLLEALKSDPSAFVRKSVANHLNDILKDNQALGLEILTRWNEDASPETRWIIRHALRNLIKRGHPVALALLGYSEPHLSLHNLNVEPAKIRVGDQLNISFTLESESDQPQDLIIDYLIHFVRANGRTSPKVFKLSALILAAEERLDVQKKQPIRPVTTRRYYPGQHRVEVQVNGKILGGADFYLETRAIAK